MAALNGHFITLEPICEDHYEKLKPNALDQNIWTYITGYSDIDNPYDKWFADTLKRHDKEDECIFIVLHNATGEAVGSTSYYKINPSFHSLDIGYTWYTPKSWGSYVNPECKLLLLTEAFEKRKCKRVEFEADARNTRSLQAIERLGAKAEGILRKRVFINEEFSKDTAVFSIIDDEWPDVKESLIKRVDSYKNP